MTVNMTPTANLNLTILTQQQCTTSNSLVSTNPIQKNNQYDIAQHMYNQCFHAPVELADNSLWLQ